LNFRYHIDGDKPAWRPLRVFDDGRQTFIEFPDAIATGEMPPLFVVGADGSSELVNYRVQGRYMVVDRLFSVAELRLGTKKTGQRVRISRDGSHQGGVRERAGKRRGWQGSRHGFAIRRSAGRGGRFAGQ
jgi:type IV secretion system protein VirB9